MIIFVFISTIFPLQVKHHLLIVLLCLFLQYNPMENQESICMSEYSYKDNLLYTSKDSEVYKATNKHHKGSQVFAFKGYPESWLTDPVK